MARLVAASVHERRSQKAVLALCGGSISAAFVLAGIGGGHAVDGPVLCPLRLLTGIPCPACGLTSSFTELAGGHIGAATSASPLGPVLFAVFAVCAVALVVLLATRRRLALARLSGRRALMFYVPLVLVMAASWVYQLDRFGYL
ncbi:MAG: DUF2752 domain-containing protein [Acidimicrobiia bacterium]